jgi:hypothetical protein
MVLGKKPEGKSPPGRPRRSWKVIMLDLKEMAFEGVAWIDLAAGREKLRAVVSRAMNIRVSKNFLTRVRN